jgi:adenylate cyclase
MMLYVPGRIITDLAKISELLVIARNSSFKFKGQTVDLRQVAGDLGVRYVLEGRVRRAGDQLRISAQLIDGGTGAHLWAERYDRPLDNVFAVQDDIARQIVQALHLELTQAERPPDATVHGRRPKPTMTICWPEAFEPT